MTDKVLSQDEVDALLKGVASGEIDTEDAKETIVAGVRGYDFTNQERIIRGKMPGLEMINDAFSRSLRGSISNFLMKYIDIAIQNVNTIKYSDFMKTIPMPSSINLFTMKPLKGYALLVLEAPLVFAFIEYFFGGNSGTLHVKSEGRAFTQIEQRVIQKVVDLALRDMAPAWQVVAPIEAEYVSTEINPQFVSIVTPAEIVIKIDIDIEIEDFAGRMFLCIPYSMVEPIKEKLSSGIHGDKFETDHRWSVIMKKVIEETHVNMSVDLGQMIVTFKDLMNFEEGNILNLGKSVSEGLLLKVEGAPKFRCTPGHSRGNQAIKLTEVIEG
jgi:flagellar motor switch protein FliM